jgi:hypothetical protein
VKKTARKTGKKAAKGTRKASRKARKRVTTGIEGVLGSLAARASEAGTKLAELSGEGAVAARRSFRAVSAKSKKTMGDMAKGWREMDTQRKAEVVIAVLGAITAAAAPLLRKSAKKK